MKDHTLTGDAAVLRDILLERADVDQALEVCNAIILGTLDAFNAAGTSVATSLLARALLARATLGVARDWWHEIQPPAKPPEIQKALISFITDPPSWLNDVSWRVGETPDAG